MTSSLVDLHGAGPMGLGPTELLVILGIVVLLFGAKRLPELAKGMGKSIKEFKKATADDGDGNDDDDKDSSEPVKPSKNGAAKAPVETERVK